MAVLVLFKNRRTRRCRLSSTTIQGTASLGSRQGQDGRPDPVAIVFALLSLQFPDEYFGVDASPSAKNCSRLRGPGRTGSRTS